MKRLISSNKNKSIYQMTKEENDNDRNGAIRLLCFGVAVGVGGFCTLWVAVALIITFVVGPPMPDIPIVVTIEDLMLESIQIEEQQKLTDPPVTIPAKPDEQDWIIVKKLVKRGE